MHQVHVAGDKMRDEADNVEPRRARSSKVEVLFVAVLGASSYTYAEATRYAEERRLHANKGPRGWL
jgi:transposase